jgi:hypothetical protein
VLLSAPQQLIDPRAKARRRGALLPLQLAVHIRQLAPERLRLITVLTSLILHVPEVLIHLAAVIAAAHHGEGLPGYLPGDVTGRGVNPQVHTLTPPKRSAFGEASN